MAGLLGDIGTLGWCRRTKARLSRGESARFITAIIAQTLRSLPRTLLSRLGLGLGGPDPSAFKPPDTALTRHALEQCAELSPMLIEHSARSYLFARGLGARDGLTYDDEALFVACMLHDLAFPSVDTTADHCFGWEGAELAAAALQRSAMAPESVHDVLDAIALHLNPWVQPSQGVLQHLLHAGVMVDTVGVRAWDLDPEGVARVIARHPRERFVLDGWSGFQAHARRVPGGRANRAVRCGFGYALRIGPWHHHERQHLPAGGAP